MMEWIRAFTPGTWVAVAVAFALAVAGAVNWWVARRRRERSSQYGVPGEKITALKLNRR
ncbi:MAG: hypothetical protein UY96_C0025G0011 [Parcubacteria group bacterium GW2011_GWB1_56_8]|nr:MAG: hypothetical protein UY96_C0025G0011 [Parcubacteria group bacterium GW2011_GWB1_56_8]